MQEVINILEGEFECLSAFSEHRVEIDGVIYKSAEHAYQALRVIPNAREKIIDAPTPEDAWQEGQLCKDRGELLAEYDKDALMEKIFRAKLEQHIDVQNDLIRTGSRELLKVHDSDYYWGTGKDGTGQNNMGKLWMKLRSKLHS